jgi:acetolactate synthase-1/2/3 large subunit
MNVSEFIVKYLKARGVKDFFGYQGTMITFFVDAIGKEEGVNNHSLYNEQGAAIAACGYSKSSGELSCAYSTSGPGAINLIQGIADAFYDSIPVVFITGQLNFREYSGIQSLRQQGFQETNMIDITRSITKYNCFIDKPEKIINVLPEAISNALSGRRGPVLIDIPMDIQKSSVELSDAELNKIINTEPNYCIEHRLDDVSYVAKIIVEEIEKANRPVFILGNGIHRDKKMRSIVNSVVKKFGIPVLSSLMSKDLISDETGLYYGFIGSSYGQRCANIVSNKKTDLIISLGCRLCTRLTGVNQKKFACNAKIIRVDIDREELKRKVHEDELSYAVDVNQLIKELSEYTISKSFIEWNKVCRFIKESTEAFDNVCPSRLPNKYIEHISNCFDYPLPIVADVGQNMMWTANSFKLHKGQELLFSGAHGAMGFALPAAIGAFYANNTEILCIAGDGGFQMNIQELQFIHRENLPIKMFIFNNNSLGMITQVQDDYLEGRKFGTVPTEGFTSPCFKDVANAYGIVSFQVHSLNEFDLVLKNIKNCRNDPVLVEIVLGHPTFSYPKTYFGEEINNQRPYLPNELYTKIMEM